MPHVLTSFEEEAARRNEELKTGPPLRGAKLTFTVLCRASEGESHA